MRTCDTCQFAIFKDHGYSNYTVEGNEFICAKDIHPEGMFDKFYGRNPKLNYAQQCAGYEEGKPVELDVDGEWRGNSDIKKHPAIKIIMARELLLNKPLLDAQPIKP